MTRITRTGTVAIVGGAVALAGAGLSAAPAVAKTKHHPAKPAGSVAATRTPAATAQDSGAQSAVGDFTNGVFSVQFNAQRAAGAPETLATGTFSAQMKLGPADVVTLNGPVTCLDVVGNHVGLFYPVTSSTPAAVASVMKGVYLSAQLGRDGQPLSMIFRPSTSTAVSHCDPEQDLIPITSGTLTLGS